ATMATGATSIDSAGEAIVFGGTRDRTVPLIMNCLPGVCLPDGGIVEVADDGAVVAEQRSARLTITAGVGCPLTDAPRGPLYVVLVSTDEVTARRLWF